MCRYKCPAPSDEGKTGYKVISADFVWQRERDRKTGKRKNWSSPLKVLPRRVCGRIASAAYLSLTASVWLVASSNACRDSLMDHHRLIRSLDILLTESRARSLSNSWQCTTTVRIEAFDKLIGGKCVRNENAVNSIWWQKDENRQFYESTLWENTLKF